MTEKHAIKFDENFFNKLGQLGSILSVMMYVSYIPQITNNLAGNKGSFIQPLVAMINCTVWVFMALSRKSETFLSSSLTLLVSSLVLLPQLLR